jgi:hypothetical protein
VTLKSKKVAFVGSQIKEFIQYVKFMDRLNEVGKNGMGNIEIYHYQFWGEIVRQDAVLIWCLILCILKKLWGVICLSACIS